MNEIKSKTDILGVYNKLKNLSEKIHEINCLHDAEITDIRYKNSILNLSLGYIPNRSNIYQIRERVTLLEVKNLIIIQSRNFGKNYSEDIEAWKKVKTRDINKLIAKGTLEFISIENRGDNYHITLFWSSNVNKKFYKRKYIKLSFS